MQENNKIINNIQNRGGGTSRDTQLDVCRALVMVYILCVIHVTYWLGTLGQPFSSLILFEMPVIFFISGAALSVGGKHRGLLSTIANRAKRVLAPYYVLAAVCVVLYIVVCIARGHDILQKQTLGVMLHALWPEDGSLPIPFTCHLWFVTPYLIVSCLFCFFQKMADKSNRWLFLLSLLSLCLLTQLLTANMLIRNVMFYGFFFMAGYLCYKKINVKSMAIIGAAAIVATALLYALSWKGSMQQHKFPPDMLFACYGIAALCILGIIFTKVTIPQNKLLRIWNTNGYTIYLWQNVTFTIFTAGVAVAFGPDFKLPVVFDFAFKAMSIFIMATALSFVAVPIERAVIRYAGRVAASLKKS